MYAIRSYYAAAAPDPVCRRRVHQHAPRGDEPHVAAEAHALDHGARDQRGGDDGEGALIGEVQQLRVGASYNFV